MPEAWLGRKFNLVVVVVVVVLLLHFVQPNQPSQPSHSFRGGGGGIPNEPTLKFLCKVTENLMLLLQRLLPIDGGHEMFSVRAPDVPTTCVYTIRPYQTEDQVRPY